MKRKNLPLVIIGYKVVRCSEVRLPELLELCRSMGISYYDVRIEREGEEEYAELLLPFFSCRRLVKGAAEEMIEVEELSAFGSIPALIFLCKRPGIIAGLLACILMILLSSAVVWDIRIDGNERLHEDEVRTLLAEFGLREGVSLSSLDPLKIENAVRSCSDDISWISVNLIGTVASIEIIETEEDTNNGRPPYECANLIATAPGVITDFLYVRGEICTSVGEQVSKGQLLVSGIYGGEGAPFYYTCAQGQVMAEVNRSLCVKVERKYKKKVYKTRKKYRKSLIFFEKEIKFFSNCRNLCPTYDKIEEVEYLYSFGGFKLPIGVRTEVFSEYDTAEALYDDESLERIAHYRMNALIASRLKEGELLSRKDSVLLGESGCEISCKLKTVENIARVQEIEIEKIKDNAEE